MCRLKKKHMRPLVETNDGLVRSLTLTDSTALVVGKVIGTGIFLKAAIMTQQV